MVRLLLMRQMQFKYKYKPIMLNRGIPLYERKAGIRIRKVEWA